MRLQIIHTTRYKYDRKVHLHAHLLYLRPRENPLLQVNKFELKIQPDGDVDWMRDDFDNLPASILFNSEANLLEICTECEVTTSDLAPFDFLLRDYAVDFPFAYEPLHQRNLGIYLEPPELGTQKALSTWLVANMSPSPNATVAWLLALNQAIQNAFSYARREEPGIQSPLTTLQLGSGSCRDFAMFMVEIARMKGIAARFVSGYLFDPMVDGRSPGEMHAWVEVFLPGAGWRGMDPTHGIFCTNSYVPVAHAVVAESVNPIQGSFFSAVPTVGELSTEVFVRQIPDIS